MKAILIDALNKEIREVEYNGNIEEIYKLINCETFDVLNGRHAGIDNGDSLYVDDEGLYNKGKGAFRFGSYSQVISGSGLLLGHNEEGESVDFTTPLEDIVLMVTFEDEASLPEPKPFILTIKK